MSTSEQSLLRDTVRKILGSSEPVSRDDAATAWPSPTWIELERAGMTGVGIDETKGGSGGSLADVATLAYESGRHATFVPIVETTLLAGWIMGLANRTWSGGVETLCISRPNEVTAHFEGSSLSLQGAVPAVPWARFAERIYLALEVDETTVLAQLAPEEFTVELGSNVAGEPRDALEIGGISLSNERWVISPVPVERIRRQGAWARTISMVGAMSSILEMSVSFASERQQFGRPIARFQAVQHLLAQLAEETFAATVSTRAALDAMSGGGELDAMSAIVRASRAATKVARIAHQVHGAIGATEEFPLHRFTNRLWSWRNEFGGEAFWSTAVANHVRERGGSEQLWSLLAGGVDETA